MPQYDQAQNMQQEHAPGASADPVFSKASSLDSSVLRQPPLEPMQCQDSPGGSQLQDRQLPRSQQLASTGQALNSGQVSTPADRQKQGAEEKSKDLTDSNFLGSGTAAQQLRAHDVTRRKWTPGETLHVTWREDPSFEPAELLLSSTASSVAASAQTARTMRSILSGTGVKAIVPEAGAQLVVSLQPPPAASVANSSVPELPIPAISVKAIVSGLPRVIYSKSACL